MPNNYAELEARLWAAADELRANSELKASQYSMPVLGLIFLRYADHKFEPVHKALQAKESARRKITVDDYKAQGIMYLPEKARYAYLRDLPESEDIGKRINEAMEAVEDANPELKGVLPKNYTILENANLKTLLKHFNFDLSSYEGDVFGKIYEYFLGKFAMSEGQKGGEFFTPTAIVKLIVEIIEPYGGQILDPACGSGGMFVQSADFVERHKQGANGASRISIYGQEKTQDTVRLCRMNLAVHGLYGDVKQANTYYEDVHHSTGRFDYVMANPPFNVDKVDKSKLQKDPRYPLGMPNVDNANYLWIQHFFSALNEQGRAGFVMANSASDARHSEQLIRQQLIEAGAVDVMIAIGSNFFYTVTLPCTLWFFDKGKRGTDRADTVLFIDARDIYTQIDRAHREFSPAQIEYLANIARLYRGEEPEFANGSEGMMNEVFPDGSYQDVAGLCKVATIDDIKAQGWSLNPGRYVGVASNEHPEDFDFTARMQELHERLELLNAEARVLEDRISENMDKLLGGQF